MRDFAAIKAKLRGEALNAVSNAKDIDPMTKRYVYANVARQAFGIDEILTAMSSPDIGSWVLWRQLHHNHPEVTLEQVENAFGAADVQELLMAISGLGVPDEKKADNGQPSMTSTSNPSSGG